jgi:amidase
MSIAAQIGPQPSLRDATSLLGEIRSGTTTARDATLAALNRIKELDGGLKAFITVSAASAMETATRLDSEGPQDRALFGLTLAVKDLLDTAGIRTTHGSLAYADHVPQTDDIVVARARRAGAVVVGKTNTPEFGFGAVCTNALCGPTANPLDPTLTSGGSSGGSAVAVATGMAAAALGTDFGGSVRMPAAFCGVVGFRPTPGRLPTLGRSLAWEASSTTGLMTRSVRDARLLFESLEGPDPGDFASLRAWPSDRTAPERPIIAATTDFKFAPMSAVVSAAFEEAVGAIESELGALTRAQPDCTGARESFATLRAAHIRHNLSGMREKLGDKLSPTVRWNIDRGDGLTAADYLAAEAKRGEITHRFVDFFRSFDLIISPSAALLPRPHDAGEVDNIDGKPLQSLIEYFSVSLVISLVGCPAISIPFWPSGARLPIGVQVVAAPGADYPLLAMAERLERVLAASTR